MLALPIMTAHKSFALFPQLLVIIVISVSITLLIISFFIPILNEFMTSCGQRRTKRVVSCQHQLSNMRNRTKDERTEPFFSSTMQSPGAL
jgi:competence protein ComGC